MQKTTIKSHPKGTTFVEYGVIIGFLSVLSFVALNYIGDQTNRSYATSEAGVQTGIDMIENEGNRDNGAGNEDQNEETNTDFIWNQHNQTQQKRSNMEPDIWTTYFLIPLDGTFNVPASIQVVNSSNPVQLNENGTMTPASPESIEICLYSEGMLNERCFGASVPSQDINSAAAMTVSIRWPEANAFTQRYEGTMNVILQPDNNGTPQSTNLAVVTTMNM